MWLNNQLANASNFNKIVYDIFKCVIEIIVFVVIIKLVFKEKNSILTKFIISNSILLMSRYNPHTVWCWWLGIFYANINCEINIGFNLRTQLLFDNCNWWTFNLLTCNCNDCLIDVI